MIVVNTKSDRITIDGHADFDDLGHDVVCAAVSSIVTTTCEAIAYFDEDAIEVKSKSGHVTINILKHDDITEKLLGNMQACIEEVRKAYPNNIKY